MNIYDSIKHAAKKNWTITFETQEQKVIVFDKCGTIIAEKKWQHETGTVTPVTALMRAIQEAKK